MKATPIALLLAGVLASPLCAAGLDARLTLVEGSTDDVRTNGRGRCCILLTSDHMFNVVQSHSQLDLQDGGYVTHCMTQHPHRNSPSQNGHGRTPRPEIVHLCVQQMPLPAKKAVRRKSSWILVRCSCCCVLCGQKKLIPDVTRRYSKSFEYPSNKLYSDGSYYRCSKLNSCLSSYRVLLWSNSL